MKIVIFGEAMLEYHSNGGEGLRYGGDTLNTAIHLARTGLEVAYVTAVGTDAISDALVDAWAAEGVDTSHVLRHPSRNPGMYAIHLDEQGERSFLYWRDRSAAREMFELTGMSEAMVAAKTADLLYFSLISLAVISSEGRDQLIGIASERKRDGRPTAYDSNFRPALWSSLAEAQAVSLRAMNAATIGLPTNTDERDLWESDESELDIAKRWRSTDQSIVAVKAGERGCVLATDQNHDPHLIEAENVQVIDSSGAGDAFNAGFLGELVRGTALEECVEAGQALARRTLGHQGAIELS